MLTTMNIIVKHLRNLKALFDLFLTEHILENGIRKSMNAVFVLISC